MEKRQTNDSFQHELEDFIRKQRARGLHPRIYFRNTAEESFHQERDCVSPGAPMLGPPLSSRKHPRSSTSYERPTVENLVPHCRRRLESLKHHQKNQPVSQDGKERPRHQEWEGATSVEQRTPKRKHHRERASHKEDRGPSRRKASPEPAGTEKSKPRKRTRHDGRDPTRSRRQSHREKKEPEERDLWDEAILGSCD
ncbi:zinc finger matrin-type protein 1-like [Peromyscus californicus insignis]|uniref:zinc finger matrin-type protein 1-like n=1 Tax=Peromyscus californicus insignis TaxID=564181 RepID=UPI0022A6CB53|nr:zinc finger matrin-type protein 1-like [Peromyscus californicus insignis]